MYIINVWLLQAKQLTYIWCRALIGHFYPFFLCGATAQFGVLIRPQGRKISVITVLCAYRVSEVQKQVETIIPDTYSLYNLYNLTIISDFSIFFLFFLLVVEDV